MGDRERLSRTESLIVATYLSRNPPPRAKDLAAELGVSVKTVYKALYKYRKMVQSGQIDKSSLNHTFSSTNGTRDVQMLVDAIADLKRSIDNLTKAVNELAKIMLQTAKYSEVLTGERQSEDYSNDVYDLPSFVKSNPWLKIINDKGR